MEEHPHDICAYEAPTAEKTDHCDQALRAHDPDPALHQKIPVHKTIYVRSDPNDVTQDNLLQLIMQSHTKSSNC